MGTLIVAMLSYGIYCLVDGPSRILGKRSDEGAAGKQRLALLVVAGKREQGELFREITVHHADPELGRRSLVVTMDEYVIIRVGVGVGEDAAVNLPGAVEAF